MRQLRKLGLLLLLTLLAFTGTVGAQASEDITVIGSAIVNSVVESLAGAAGAAVDIETTGTAAGIDQFCNGEIGLATATREITAAEGLICSANDVGYSKFLIGHHIVSFVAGADVPLECLSTDQIESMLRPTASNTVLDWSFNDDESDLALTLILPPDDRIEYAILDGIVAGDRLRQDVATYTDSAEAIALASETAGAIAILPWADSPATDADVTILELRSEAGDCSSPSAQSAESGDYLAAQSLYLYVNRAQLESSDRLERLLQFILDEANAPLIAAAGVTTTSSAMAELNAAVLANSDALAGDESGAYDAPSGLSGEIRITGAANSFPVLDRVGEQLSVNSDELELTYHYAGQEAGIARLCSDEADIVTLDADLSADALADCEAKEIVTLSLSIGAQATVLLAHAGDEHAACLTTAQINTSWRAESAETVLDWSDVDPSFQPQSLTLFGLTNAGAESDILLQTAGQVIPPVRRDTELDFDPLYRAAAVANVSGALTYMSWDDYQRVQDNDQANINLVAVDAGVGCVVPSPESIEAGAYPLSRPASLIAREQSLADPNLQSFLWTLFDDENLSLLEGQGFIGLSRIDLPAIRLSLRQAFAQAELKFPPPAEDEAAAPDEPVDMESDGADSG